MTDLSTAGFSDQDVRIACANWRTSEAKKMPTPGELLAYCRKVFRPELVAATKVEALPKPRPSADERAMVKKGLADLADKLRGSNQMNFRQLARRPGETEAAQAERLWPSRRADRVYGREAI